MKLNIVDKGHSNVMNGADIPDGTVFTSTWDGNAGLYIKGGTDYGRTPSVTIISSPVHPPGCAYSFPEHMNFPDYKVVEELTAVVK